MFLSLVLATNLFIFIVKASNSDECLPTLWNEAPSSIADYPLVNDCSTSQCTIDPAPRLINPWLYLDRLGMYKILIITTSPLMRMCSTNASNVIFGLASQFGWQFDSNRLYTNGTTQLSTDSWWASANYYLSVIPFLAAVDVGIIRQGSFQVVQLEHFCSTSDECSHQVPEAMNQWRLFFNKLLQPTYCPHDNVDDRVIDECYLAPLWSAHVASIEEGLPLVESKVPLLPSRSEQRFILGWANIVGILAMAREPTNLPDICKYQNTFLPKRLLQKDDEPPYCKDLPQTVNQALHTLFIVPDEWYPTLKIVWKQATCNYEARRNAQYLLQTVATSLPTAMYYFSKALVNSIWYKCDE